MIVTYYPEKLQHPPLRTFKLDHYLLAEGTNVYPDEIASHPSFDSLVARGVIEINEHHQEIAKETTQKIDSEPPKSQARRSKKVEQDGSNS